MPGLGLDSGDGGAGGGASIVRRTVSGSATGALYTIARLLGSSSTVSLVAGTNANLTLSGLNVQAAAAIGAGSSQTAVVREYDAATLRAEEYPVIFSGAAVVPAAPTLGTPVASSGQLSIPFTDGSNGGATITAHKVYRSTVAGFTPGPSNLIGSLSTGSPFVDTGLTNLTTYYYRMSAVNSAGEGAFSAQVSGVPNTGSPLITMPQASRVIYQLDPDSLNASTADGATPASITDTAGGNVAPIAGGMTLRKNVANGHSVLRCAPNGFGRVQIGRPAAVAAAMANARNYSWAVVIRAATGQSGGGGNLFGDAGDNTAVQKYAANAGEARGYGLIPFNWRASAPASGYHVLMYSGDGGGRTTGVGRFYVDGTMVGQECPATIHATRDLFLGALPINSDFTTNGYDFYGDIVKFVVWDTGCSAPEALQFYQYTCDWLGLAQPTAGMPYFPVFDGDSQIAGVGVSNLANTYLIKLANAKGWPNGAFANVGKGSAVVGAGQRGGNNMMDSAARDVDGFRQVTGLPIRLFCLNYYNRQVDNIAPATMANEMRSYAADRKAANSDTFVVIADSFTNKDDDNIRRPAYNADLAGNLGAANLLVKVSNDNNVGLYSAKPPAGSSANFNDGIHLNDNGQTVQESLIEPAFP